MNEHIDDRLPFYINHTLSAAEVSAVEAHLSTCLECRAYLSQWEVLSAAAQRTVQKNLSLVPANEKPPIPPLSPLVYAGLKRRPPFRQAVASTAYLVWVQRVILFQGWQLPFLGCLILLGFLAACAYPGVHLKPVFLFAVVPTAAALSTAFVYSNEEDPAYEIVATAPTSPGALLFARITLTLTATGLLGFLGSLLLFVFGQQAQPLFTLVAIWLGPALLLSAFTTALSLCLHPQASAGISLTTWGSLLLLLIAEQAGIPLLNFSFIRLLQPDWILLTAQILLASLVWLAGWLWLARHNPSHLSVVERK